MAKEKTVDYAKAMRDFEKSQGRKKPKADPKIRSTFDPDGGVDYRALMQKFDQYQRREESEVMHHDKQ